MKGSKKEEEERKRGRKEKEEQIDNYIALPLCRWSIH